MLTKNQDAPASETIADIWFNWYIANNKLFINQTIMLEKYHVPQTIILNLLNTKIFLVLMNY